MTAERWERLKDLFEAALEREEAERAAFLERACAGDPQLHAEAAELLRNHEQRSGKFWRDALRYCDFWGRAEWEKSMRRRIAVSALVLR